MEIISIIFIGIIAWLVLLAFSYLIAIITIVIVNKVKAAIKRKGAIYV